jgi:hypothetical protein
MFSPDNELHDHYCRAGDGTCPDREPRTRDQAPFHPRPPADAHVQCRTCRFADLCFAGGEFFASEGEAAGDGEVVTAEPDHTPYRDPELDREDEDEIRQNAWYRP